MVAAAIVVTIGAFALGRATAPGSPTPGQNSAEAGFARDMQVHHAQAVEMALIVRDSSDDASVRSIAYDIATSQAQQSGQMFGWLAAWGLSQAANEPSMTWMTRPARDGSAHHDDASVHTPGDPMPGLATSAELATLRTATGIDAERVFLELMIEHHRGGVDMAKAVLTRTSEKVVTELATSIVVAQSSEIGAMQNLLDARR